MSDSQKQMRNASLYMIPFIVGNAIPILTLPIFTRILTVEDYGVYALSSVYALFVTGIANFGLTIGYERNFFESKDIRKIAGLLFSTVLFVLFTFIFFGFLTYIFKDFLSLKIIGSTKHADILFWSYCATGIMALKTYYLSFFKNTENAKAFVLYTIDESVIGVLFSLFFVVNLKIGLIGLIWGQLLASSLIFIALSIKFLRMLPFEIDFNGLKSSLKLSLPLTSRIFFGVISTQFDKYMIGLLGTLGGVGVYNFGQKIGNISFTFMTALQNVFAPQVYKRMFDMGEDGKSAIGKYLTPFMYISVGGSLLLALFCEELIILLTPKPYHGAIDVVSVLCLLYSTYFFGKQPQLVYEKKTNLLSYITLTSIVLNIIINIPMIKYFGYIGAAYGTLIAGIISGSISFFLSQKYYSIKWEYKKVVTIYGILFTSTLLVIILRDLFVAYTYIAILKIFFVGIYVVIGYKFNILTPVLLTLKKTTLFNLKKNN
jgi:O-antigen/teichoic acid export membrane protein